jgi:predicted membrane protein
MLMKLPLSPLYDQTLSSSPFVRAILFMVYHLLLNTVRHDDVLSFLRFFGHCFVRARVFLRHFCFISYFLSLLFA